MRVQWTDQNYNLFWNHYTAKQAVAQMKFLMTCEYITGVSIGEERDVYLYWEKE